MHAYVKKAKKERVSHLVRGRENRLPRRLDRGNSQTAQGGRCKAKRGAQFLFEKVH